jgi:hypothetical protein
MKTRMLAQWYQLGTVLIRLGIWLLVSPTPAHAQFCKSTQGYNMVWGTCPRTGGPVSVPTLNFAKSAKFRMGHPAGAENSLAEHGRIP